MERTALRTGVVAAIAAAAFASAVESPPSGNAARAERRAGLVAELLAEGAGAEALAEAARLRLELPGETETALAPLAPALALEAGSSDGIAETFHSDLAPQGGIGGWLARRVVGFYRTFVGPALGSRCALEPSCSRYFLLAARKHGLLGVPMTADRFVREPVVSAPDRPWVRNADGAWRHPDPVEDHDGWFAGEGR